MNLGINIDQVKIRVLPDGRVSLKDAAKFIGVSYSGITAMVADDRGPRTKKVGGRRFSTLDWLHEYVAADQDEAA